MKVNILRANFTVQANCPRCTTTSVASSLRKQRKKSLTLLANEEVEEAHNFLRSQQANRRSRKQLLRINCPIINSCNKQRVLRRNFFPWKASKNSSRVKCKKTEEENTIRYKCFLRVYRDSGRSWLN